MSDKRLPFAVAYRMRFIDFLLNEYGTLNRSALVDYFGISTPQASNDIGLYQELAPGNVEYDTSAKTYRRTRSFVRIWP
jgi:hypothetical protein